MTSASAHGSAPCARLAELGGPDDQQELRREGILCAEVCDATCRALAEQSTQAEAGMCAQVEWCRAVCLETAQVLDRSPGAEDSAQVCRDCARPCTEFLALLR
ncbi:hypothetical protein [Streptomyces sp. NPDC050988]|uniref:hypothetical protein n=1 Tax=Streptomyces sp. NPDC050988 TaxID=3365637 RepID=UPI0037AED3EB